MPPVATPQGVTRRARAGDSTCRPAKDAGGVLMLRGASTRIAVLRCSVPSGMRFALLAPRKNSRQYTGAPGLQVLENPINQDFT